MTSEGGLRLDATGYAGQPGYVAQPSHVAQPGHVGHRWNPRSVSRVTWRYSLDRLGRGSQGQLDADQQDQPRRCRPCWPSVQSSENTLGRLGHDSQSWTPRGLLATHTLGGMYRLIRHARPRHPYPHPPLRSSWWTMEWHCERAAALATRPSASYPAAHAVLMRSSRWCSRRANGAAG